VRTGAPGEGVARAKGKRSEVIRILLVEDHAAFRSTLAILLEREPDMEVVAQAGSIAEAREALDRPIDVAVIDLILPDADGTELIEELRRSKPGVCVLVLSATIEPGHTEELLRAGADAVLGKIEDYPMIVEQVRRLALAG
jgi:DNA-binding NarL/FixJ family response regulator